MQRTFRQLHRKSGWGCISAIIVGISAVLLSIPIDSEERGLATLEIAQHIRYVGAASNVEEGLNVEVIVQF